MFKEGSTFRNILKSEARNVVDESYNITLTLTEFDCGNQEEYYAITREKVAALLKDGEFQRDGKDINVRIISSVSHHWNATQHQGRTNNLAHPAIGKLIGKIFYSGPESLAKKFPEDFKNSVPEHAVALAITCVRPSSQWDQWLTILILASICPRGISGFWLSSKSWFQRRFIQTCHASHISSH